MTLFLSRNHPLGPLQWTWRAGGSCAVLVTVAAWWLLVGEPGWRAHEDLVDQLDAAKSLRTSATEVESRLAQARAEVEHWRREDAIRRERASQHHDEAGFLRWVNQQAQASGVRVRDFRPSGREQQGDYQGRGVMLSAQGPYESICRLLDRLRACPRMIRTTRLEITPRDTDRTMYALSLQVMLFSYSPQQPPASAKRG